MDITLEHQLITLLLTLGFAKMEDTFETKVTLSHALIEEAQIIRLHDYLTHTAYIDLSPPFNYLEELEEHTTKVENHLKADKTHLEGTDIFAMENNNTYYTYFLNEGYVGISKNEGCFLIGGEAVKPDSEEGWKLVGQMVKQFNEENEGTDIPVVEKLVVPVTLDNSISKLRYVGLGSKNILNLGTNIATRENLLKAGSAFPLYNIESEAFEFREDNSEGQYALCKIIRSQKLAQAPVWRTLVSRKIVEVSAISKRIAKSKEFLLKILGELAEFSYTLGNKLLPESLGQLDDLANLTSGLSTHSAERVYDSGTYAIANVFLDRTIREIREKLQYYQNSYMNEQKILKNILETAIKPLVSIVTNNMKGLTKVEPFLDAFKQSVKTTSMKYDATSRVLLQQFQYVSPKASDLLRYYQVLKFPFFTRSYEVTLNIPFEHIVQGENVCVFVEPTRRTFSHVVGMYFIL